MLKVFPRQLGRFVHSIFSWIGKESCLGLIGDGRVLFVGHANR